MLALILGPNDGLAIGWGIPWDEGFKKQDLLVSLVGRLNAIRKKYPSFLLEGRMIKPFLTCSSKSSVLRVYEEPHASVEVPNVFVSFWENAKGERIGFETNWCMEPSELKMLCPDGSEKVVHLAPLETIEIHE